MSNETNQKPKERFMNEVNRIHNLYEVGDLTENGKQLHTDMLNYEDYPKLTYGNIMEISVLLKFAIRLDKLGYKKEEQK